MSSGGFGVTQFSLTYRWPCVEGTRLSALPWTRESRHNNSDKAQACGASAVSVSTAVWALPIPVTPAVSSCLRNKLQNKCCDPCPYFDFKGSAVTEMKQFEWARPGWPRSGRDRAQQGSWVFLPGQGVPRFKALGFSFWVLPIPFFTDQGARTAFRLQC